MKSLYQKAFKVLEISFGEAHSSSVKLFMAYRYGRPNEMKDTHLFVEQPLFTIDFREGDWTMIYTHISERHIGMIKNPLDVIFG